MNSSRLNLIVPWLALAARLYLGGLFVLACYHKIAYPAEFALDVATYQFLPLWSVNAFALTVPWIELWVGLLLILGLRVRAAALVTSLLLVSFMVALSYALIKGLDMSCGCFASQGAVKDDPISYRTVLRDTSWLLLGLFVLFFDRRPLGVERLFAKRQAT
jgi:uncharacterized membrane protein YphA (DoxX/SURF4 family)